MLEVNVLGTMHGCQVALQGMRAAGGAIYNVFGAGSDGRPIDHMIGYSTTKRAVQFLTQSLVGEVRGLPVLVGAISPGLRSEEHTSELQSLMSISYDVFCLKHKKH